jgi:hypothetical protein
LVRPEVRLSRQGSREISAINRRNSVVLFSTESVEKLWIKPIWPT